jgi:hypothetical protein
MAQGHPKKIIRTTAGGVLLSLMTLFLTVTEGSLKSVLNAVIGMEECVVVFEIREDGSSPTEEYEIITVELFAAGKSLKNLPVTFKTPQPNIVTVEFEQKQVGGNWGFHPLSGYICPGGSPKGHELCPNPVKEGDYYKQITYDLKPFDKAFSYPFKIRLLKNTPVSDLSVFVKYASHETGSFCRVERAGLVNLLMRLSPSKKFIVFVLIFALLSFGIALLRRGD